MEKWVKCLPDKHGDMSSSPWNLHKVRHSHIQIGKPSNPMGDKRILSRSWASWSYDHSEKQSRDLASNSGKWEPASEAVLWSLCALHGAWMPILTCTLHMEKERLFWNLYVHQASLPPRLSLAFLFILWFHHLSWFDVQFVNGFTRLAHSSSSQIRFSFLTGKWSRNCHILKDGTSRLWNIIQH